MNRISSKQEKAPQFVLCIRKGDEEDLEVRKAYRILPSRPNESGFLRVIDESGEDYLYPEDYFIGLELSTEAEKALSMTA